MYSLTQIRRPSLSHWSVIYHPNEGLWSSLGPKYELYNPKDGIRDFLTCHGGLSPFNLEELPNITRAIYYQPLVIFCY